MQVPRVDFHRYDRRMVSDGPRSPRRARRRVAPGAIAALTVLLAIQSIAGCTALTGLNDLTTEPPVDPSVAATSDAQDDRSTPPVDTDAFVPADAFSPADAADAADASDGADTAVPALDGGINLTVTVTTTNYDVFVAAGSPSGVVAVQVVVAAGVTIKSSSTSLPSFTTGALATGSTVVLVNNGSIIGAGGRGGSGGNGGGGSAATPCGRPGDNGGRAIELTVPVDITNGGLIAGGGGGGGGASGNNDNAGGGGGAGSIGGAGGAGATSLSMQAELAYCGQDNGVRTGSAGAAGGATPGAGGSTGLLGLVKGGAGGAYGRAGNPTASGFGVNPAPGGIPGNAIKRNAHACNIADGAYATGAGAVRGPVAP